MHRLNMRAGLTILFLPLLATACRKVDVVEVVTTVEVPIVKTVEVEVVKTQEVTVLQTQVVEVPREEFTTPHPILGDLRVRQAIAYCSDKPALVHAVYPLLNPQDTLSLVMDGLLPATHWAALRVGAGQAYPYDPKKGIALLEQAGWTLSSGRTYRTNRQGKELSLKLTLTQAAYQQRWSALWESQLKQCGIRVLRFSVPSDWWFGNTTGLAQRDFELGVLNADISAGPVGEERWLCDRVPSAENNWQGENYGGWCHLAANEAVTGLGRALTQAEKRRWYEQLQRAFLEDLPALPLFNRIQLYAIHDGLSGFTPQAGEPVYTFQAGGWGLPNNAPIAIAITQEPESLSSLSEDAFVTQMVLSLIGAAPRHFTTGNYAAQPLLWEQIPMVKNGLVRITTVDVDTGALIVAADGRVTSLLSGVSYLDRAGKPTIYQGGVVKLPQIVVTYPYRNELRWPDGERIESEDIALGYRVACDKNLALPVYAKSCERIQSYQVDGLSATRTYLPGDIAIDYLRGDFPIFPAHRVLSIGQRLVNVSPVDWLDLRELNETPWGFGPYVIRKWVKGERISFDAHPYWYGGKPQTENLNLFVTTPAQAEAGLLAGRYHILGPDTLPDLTPDLVAGQDEGDVELIVLPGNKWEMVNFALFIR